MTHKEIIDIEQENTGYINLHLEGTFYKAYEQSAFAFCTRIEAYNVLRKESKTLGRDILYVGFPKGCPKGMSRATSIGALPAAGYRDGSAVRDVGDYWSSSAYNEYDAYAVSFVSTRFDHYCGTRDRGCSVRLVTEVK